MISIRAMTPADIPALCELACTVWQATYPGLISQAQIEYMLTDRYDAAKIHAQLDDAVHAWRLACWADEIIGFAHARMEDGICKLDKLYIRADFQRCGVGRALLEDTQVFARARGATVMRLQVNRGNHAALAAYQRYGFTIREARVFDIGGGFVMDDYVMEASI